MIDDGVEPVTTMTYGDFSTLLSRKFGGPRCCNLNESAGGFHGTTTSGLIGDSGAHGLPVGLAPNAEIIGVKVTFGDAPWSEFVQALQYASSVGEVVSNSWVFDGYGVGASTDPNFASWYGARQTVAQFDRGGLDLSGSVIIDNAFWGENSAGAWTLEVVNTGGSKADVTNGSLTLWGDNAATVATPLVYTPEFASLAAADPSRIW